MLRRYRMALLMAVAATLAWLNLRPRPETEVVHASERLAAASGVSDRRSAASGATALVQKERAVLEPALRDPFSPEAPPPVPAPAPVAPASPAPPAPPARVPLAAPVLASTPAFSMRFAGRMRAPDGTDVVYVADGEKILPVTVGQSLPNGYRVEAMTVTAVEFRNPSSNTTARLELPAPPPFEIR